MEIRELDNNKEIIDTISKWYYGWWNNNTLEEVQEKIKKSINSKGLPRTYILLDNKELIGAFQILDNDNCDLYSPWLANLYIRKDMRKKGYGSYILNNLPNILKGLNINMIYLHTRHKDLYERFNWKYLEKLDEIRNIYYLELR